MARRRRRVRLVRGGRDVQAFVERQPAKAKRVSVGLVKRPAKKK